VYTIFSIFAATADGIPSRPFLMTPPSGEQQLAFLTYGDVLDRVIAVAESYREAGYGKGHRVAFLVGQCPEYVVHWLALNRLGVPVVPMNPLAPSNELLNQFGHADVDLLITAENRRDEVNRWASAQHRRFMVGDLNSKPPRPARGPNSTGDADAETPAALLYTSGTTGLPKACILTNRYFAVSAHTLLANCAAGSRQILHGRERIYCPFPFYHAVCTCLTVATIFSGNCMILADRFHPQRWWHDIGVTEATIACYFSVVLPLLLELPVTQDERTHQLKFGYGAGAVPTHRRKFEERFRVPLFEFWAMTETGRGFVANGSNRRFDVRSIGTPSGTLEVMVADETGQQVPQGVEGELLVRSCGRDPRHGFFAGYLDDLDATEACWHDDWFHTGDLVRSERDETLTFLDRKKHVIRRSGENVSALEVEATLLTHPDIAQATVIAVPDDLREEEVLACLVLSNGTGSYEKASAITEWALERLSYYKVPGFICFKESLPMTSTQRIAKNRLFEGGVDARLATDCHDVRALKARRARN
jgi:crotonobetaine/carnitine-CoA ligase